MGPPSCSWFHYAKKPVKYILRTMMKQLDLKRNVSKLITQPFIFLYIMHFINPNFNIMYELFICFFLPFLGKPEILFLFRQQVFQYEDTNHISSGELIQKTILNFKVSFTNHCRSKFSQSKNLILLFPLISLSKHIILYALGRFK